MSFYRIFPGLSILVRGWKRGRRPRSRTPRRASAHRAPERSEGKRTGGRADATAYATPGRAVRAPTEGRGGPGGSRAVGCADHDGREATGVTPPLCPGMVFEDFFYFMSKTPSLPGRSWLSDGPLAAFSVGHWWATWATYVVFPWRSIPSLAHRHSGPCHAWAIGGLMAHDILTVMCGIKKAPAAARGSDGGEGMFRGIV